MAWSLSLLCSHSSAEKELRTGPGTSAVLYGRGSAQISGSGFLSLPSLPLLSFLSFSETKEERGPSVL